MKQIQKIIVTGGSRGIGFQIVEDLINDGFDVLSTYFNTTPDFKHPKLTWLKIDLANPDEWVKLKNIINESSFDCLINNAAIFDETPFSSDDNQWSKYWDRLFKVNLFSAVTFSKWILNKWSKQKKAGKLINITSRAAYRGESDLYPAYGASKAALNNFTKTVARSFSKYGITAVNIAPGFVKTDMAQNAIDDVGIEYLENQTVTGSIAEAKDISEVVIDIIKLSSNQISGSTIHINGGSHMI